MDVSAVQKKALLSHVAGFNFNL